MSESSSRLNAYFLSATAAVAGAIGVSICCIAPFVLLAFGITGVHFIEAVEPYRPFVIVAEFVAYLSYRHFRPPPSCEADAPPSTFKQIVFWLAVAAIVAAIVAVGW